MSNYYQPDPTIEHFEEQTDEWHTHGGAEPTPQSSHGEVSPKLISIALISSFVAIFLIIAFFTYMFKVDVDAAKADALEVDTGVSYVELATRAKSELAGVGWIDEKAGLVRAPIELAMKDVVTTYEKLQSGPEAAKAPPKPAAKPPEKAPEKAPEKK